MKGPTTAYMLVTNRCNMRCKYCYERDFFKDMTQDMTLETMNKTSDFLAGNADPNKFTQGDNHASIFYFGGEPTLNWKNVKENIIYTRSLKEKLGIKFALYFLTNGLRMPDPPEDFLETLKKYNLAVQVSIDGCKQAHDSTRGNFDEVCDNIKTMTKYLQRSVMVRMTVTPDNIDLAYESFVTLNKLSCQVALTLALESDWQDKHIETVKREFKKIMNYYRKSMVMRPIKFNIAEKLVKGGFNFCHTGSNMVGITVDGDLYPCHRFIFHENRENWKMGDLSTGVKRYPDFSKIFRPCEACECTVCHPCPSSMISNNMRVGKLAKYCDVYKAIQESCEPIARGIHDYNLEQVLLKFMAGIMKGSKCPNES